VDQMPDGNNNNKCKQKLATWHVAVNFEIRMPHLNHGLTLP